MKMDNRTRLLTTLVAILAAILLPGLARSDSMQCGQSLVSPGDSKATVLEKCGEPMFRETVSGGAGSSAEKTEEWVYNPGEGQFKRVLTFKGLELTGIRVLTSP